MNSIVTGTVAAFKALFYFAQSAWVYLRICVDRINKVVLRFFVYVAVFDIFDVSFAVLVSGRGRIVIVFLAECWREMDLFLAQSWNRFCMYKVAASTSFVNMLSIARMLIKTLRIGACAVKYQEECWP